MNEDILSVAVSQLKVKVDSIMLEINGIISSATYIENAADKVASKIIELSIANQAHIEATSLFAQALAQKLIALGPQTKKSEQEIDKQEEE